MPQTSIGPEILTVSRLTSEIKYLLEGKYRFVRVSGEISNLKTPFSGHSYFTLKESDAQLQAVLFKQSKRFIKLNIQNGQEVVCFGRISVYEPKGNYQLVIDSIELFGTGQLQQELERLKKKLAAQGYFDSNRKRVIPRQAKKIAVISSPSGAAFADFLKIAQLRSSSAHIQLFPVRVQGREAPQEIAAAIEQLDNLHTHEIIVLIRGGGSLEDLRAYNDEQVADAIFHARLPVITGVGHEIDFTIADFCADHRCPTPTAVAEQLFPDKSLLQRQLNTCIEKLALRMRFKLNTAEQQLQHQLQGLDNITQLLKDSEHRLEMRYAFFLQALDDMLTDKTSHLQELQHKLHLQSPHTKIHLHQNKLATLTQRIKRAIAQHLEKKKSQLGSSASLLHSVSPLATLARGYSITKKESQKGQGVVVRSVDDVQPGESIRVLVSDGTLISQVRKTSKNVLRGQNTADFDILR